jgi:hypothetical protein
MTDRLSVRAPTTDDLLGALKDMVTLRTAPPLVVSFALLIILTGNLVGALLAVAVVSFVHAFWARLVEPASTPRS